MPSRKSSKVMTQSQWRDWAKQRRQDSRKIAKTYERQADAVEKMLVDRGCSCNPIIALRESADGGPSAANPMLTHSFDCDAK